MTIQINLLCIIIPGRKSEPKKKSNQVVPSQIQPTQQYFLEMLLWFYCSTFLYYLEFNGLLAGFGTTRDGDGGFCDTEMFGKHFNQRRISFTIMWLRAEIDRQLAW